MVPALLDSSQVVVWRRRSMWLMASGDRAVRRDVSRAGGLRTARCAVAVGVSSSDQLAPWVTSQSGVIEDLAIQD